MSSTTKENIIIRKAKEGDVDSIVCIEENCFDDELYSKNIIKQDLNNERMIFLVAELEGKVVAYISAIYIFEECNIIKIATLRQYRKQNIGSMLIESLRQMLAKIKVSEIFLEVKSTNKIAISFYKKLGFVTEFTRKKYYKDGNDALVMRFVST